MYHYTDGGLRNVWLANGYAKHSTLFGDGVAIQDLGGLTQAICTVLTKKPGVLSGVEFRYLRNAGMLLSQPALGSSWAPTASQSRAGRSPVAYRAGRTS